MYKQSVDESGEFDLIVIGAGPGGYSAAIRAAQLGSRVACVEERKTLGGTCLNVGCIPSKSMLNFSEKYHQAKEEFSEIGIETKVKLDLQTMLSRKDKVVADLCKGIESLFVKNKISHVRGRASFINENTLEIKQTGKTYQITGKKILIATGSNVTTLPNIKIDEDKIVSSTGALDFKSVPKELIVIGGGYIGLELGSVWNRLGSKVTVIEYADRIVPALDSEIGKSFFNILKKQGIEFKLSTKVNDVQLKSGKVQVKVSNVGDEAQNLLMADKVLVSVGRMPNTKGLGLENIGVKLDEFGRIAVDKNFTTNVKSVYAIGDVIRGPMLAHKAEEEGVAAVEMMHGQKPHIDYNLIPSVVYTYPEVASVGATEDELKKTNVEYKVGKFPFLANSRARAVLSIDGVVKLLVEKKTDKILGCHIIGPEAGTLIAEIVAYMEFGATAEDIARTTHAHPTLSEAIKEAALASDKRTINI